MLIKIADIDIDDSLTPRFGVQSAVVERYADAVSAGVELPAITVGKRNQRYVLIDGRHRLKAWKLKELEQVPATVTLAKESDWFHQAIALNIANGLALSNAEKWMCARKLIASGSKLESVAKLLCVPTTRISQFANYQTPRREQPNGAVTHTTTSHDGKRTPVESDYRAELLTDSMIELTQLIEKGKLPKSCEQYLEPLGNAIWAWLDEQKTSA